MILKGQSKSSSMSTFKNVQNGQKSQQKSSRDVNMQILHSTLTQLLKVTSKKVKMAYQWIYKVIKIWWELALIQIFSRRDAERSSSKSTILYAQNGLKCHQQTSEYDHLHMRPSALAQLLKFIPKKGISKLLQHSLFIKAVPVRFDIHEA